MRAIVTAPSDGQTWICHCRKLPVKIRQCRETLNPGLLHSTLIAVELHSDRCLSAQVDGGRMEMVSI